MVTKSVVDSSKFKRGFLWPRDGPEHDSDLHFNLWIPFSCHCVAAEDMSQADADENWGRLPNCQRSEQAALMGFVSGPSLAERWYQLFFQHLV